MPDYHNLLQSLSKEPVWSTESEAAILEPFTFITANPGKDVRGRLIQSFNDWLHVSPDNLQVIEKIVNMLHAASLMYLHLSKHVLRGLIHPNRIDDIEDDSQLRRGNPVAHKIYGIPQTINSANYVYFLAFQELFALRDSPVPPRQDLDQVVTAELLSLHRGQGLEILWRDSLQCPTEEEYIDMVSNKTGGLLRIGIKLMMACSTTNVDENYIPLISLFGIYFQIRDDLMNLSSPEYTSNKGFAEDLTEGKFSFPVVHGIHADRSNRQILNVLQKRPQSPALKIHTIEYLRHRTKSFDYTLAVLETLEKQTRDEIARLGGNPGLERIMDLLHVDESKFS